MSSSRDTGHRETDPDEQQGPIIRDKRKIDPVTFQAREPRETAAPGSGEDNVDEESTANTAADAELADLKTQVAERTADLQRLQAEYVNYKRRVDRDRDLIRKATVENVLKDLLNVLDDVRSAREHDELTGGFKAVGDELERVTAKHGLESYGTKGEPFDPHIHEALLHSHAEGIDGPTCVEILQPGYRVGERILRPARVAVAEPSEPAEPAADVPTDSDD